MFSPSSPIDIKPDSSHLLAMANNQGGGDNSFGGGKIIKSL